MAKDAQRKDKQQWAVEKPKLDNVRRLSGIHFLDQEGIEFKETMKKRAEKVGIAYGTSYAL